MDKCAGFFAYYRGNRPLLEFNVRGEEHFAGDKFRGRKISRYSIRSGYYFRGRKISRKIPIREYSENFLHAKKWCYTVLHLHDYQCKANYLIDSQCGPFRNITGSLGCLPSPISIVWKFSDCPHKCPDW